MQGLVVTQPAVLAGLTVLCAALAGWAGWQWLRRRWLRAGLATTCTLLVCLVTAADYVNAHYQYLPSVRDVADVAFPGVAYPRLSRAALQAQSPADARGGVVRIPLADGHDGFGASYELVYLPTAYFTSATPLPVVYLLHGSPGSAADWFRAARAAAVGSLLDSAGHPTVLVAPQMSTGWTDDSECVDGARLRAESHLLDVVMPTTDRLLRVRTDRDDTTVAGNSAGGYCALNIGLRHRDLFATIIDMSGYTVPTYSGGLARLFGRGPGLQEEIRANSPAVYGPTLPPGPPVRVWFDSGKGDRSPLAEEESLDRALASRTDLTTRLVTRPGGHTYGVWRPALRDALLWDEAAGRHVLPAAPA